MRNAGFRSSSEENDVCIYLRLQAIRHLGKPLRWPTLRGSVRCAGTNGDPQHTLARVANALGNVCAPSQPCGLKCILQQQGNIEFLLSKLRDEPFAAGESGV